MESHILVILIFSFLIYKYVYMHNVVYLYNESGSKRYLVRDISDKETAVKMLDTLYTQLINLTKKLMSDNDESLKQYKQYIETINSKIYDVEIQESPSDSNETSYSINKGETIVFCIRSKFHPDKFHDINELLYVAIHEIAHIGCPEKGHTKLFNSINKILLLKAVEYKIYNYTDYSNNNIEYCGMMLTSTILN